MTAGRYPYVGPSRIADRVRGGPEGRVIETPDSVRCWIDDSQQAAGGGVTATYVVDEPGRLLLADRRSEHVACAGGRPVRAAGEIEFDLSDGVEVVRVSNQSTGYCPDPESWDAVAEALAAAGLVAPKGFDPECVFRRCPDCSTINIVKDGVYFCSCGAGLPAAANIH